MQVVVAVRVSGAPDFAELVTLIELALGRFGTLDAFEAWASAFAGDINAAAVILREGVLDASQSTRPADGLGTIAFALCRTARETGSS